VTYTPAANYHGSDSFTFKASDGKADSNTATVSITVNPVNDLPNAVATASPTSGSAPLVVSFDGSGSSDVEGIIDYEWDLGDGASAYGETATYTYAAAGTYEVTLYVFDTDGASDSASVTITVVTNTAPVAQSRTVNTAEDVDADAALMATDAEGDALTYVIMTQPGHGALSGTAPDLVYTPDADYYGTDSFTWKASDGKLESNTAAVNLNITPVNDAPVANDQALSTGVGSPVDVTLSASDAEGDALSYAIVTAPAHGSIISDDGDRYVTYSPDDGFSGEDTFTFSADDGLLESAAATVTVSVSGSLVEIVSVSTGKPYSLATAEAGALYYIDRSYTVKELSANLDGMVLVRTANNDKRVKTEQHLTLRLGQTATLSVCYDKRADLVPDWLMDGTWVLTSESMSVTDKQASPLQVYERTVAAGEVTLGGNLAAGAVGTKSNYVVVVRPAGVTKGEPCSAEATQGRKGLIEFLIGPLAANEWLNTGDTDGDGLTDAFEAMYPEVDPKDVDTDDDTTMDEDELGPDGRSLWEMQEDWIGDGDDDGSDGGSGGGGGGSGGGCFLETTGKSGTDRILIRN
jgi:PKD repeat protein